MQGEPGPGGNASDVGRVTEDVLHSAQHFTGLGAEPLLGPGPEPHHRNSGSPRSGHGLVRDVSPRVIGTAIPSWHHDDREVGNRRRIDIGNRQRPLLLPRGPLHIDCSLQQSRGDQCSTHLWEVTSQLHDHCRIGLREPPGQFRFAHRARENRHHILVTAERSGHGRCRALDGCDSRHDPAIHVLQPIQQIHVGGEEQRISLSQKHHITDLEEFPQPRSGSVVEIGHGPVITPNVVGGTGGHGVLEDIHRSCVGDVFPCDA